MSEILKNHLSRFITITDDEFAEIFQYFSTKTVKKKENLLIEGQICKTNYFVEKGILRKYFIDNTGKEQTTQFAIENWWMTDDYAFEKQTKTDFCIQAVEKCDLLIITRNEQDKLLEKHPIMEKYFRCIYQIAFAATQRRIKFTYDMSKEDLYHFFVKSQPNFFQRVPQYLIASYLDFTPEYLSKIRKKSIS